MGTVSTTREVVSMPVASIAVDRWPMDRKTLSYARLIEEGAEFPPIRVFLRDGRWWISDGRHRLLAHRMLGIPRIKVKRATRRNRGKAV